MSQNRAYESSSKKELNYRIHCSFRPANINHFQKNVIIFRVPFLFNDAASVTVVV
jgi:hypothetical protein